MKLFFLSLFLFATSIAFAQVNDTVRTSASLASATVYYGYGAELEHKAKPQLINGVQHVVIDNLALQPDSKTIQIACPENVTILSYYHRTFTTSVIQPVNVLTVRASDTIRQLRKEVHAITNEYSINEDILRRITGLIETNFVTDNKKQLSSAELIRLTDYYSNRVVIIRNRLYQLELRKADLNDRIGQITTRIDEINNQAPQNIAAAKQSGQLILQVMTGSGGSADFSVSYFTRNAGWIPAYDMRVKTLDNSLKLVFRATVQQTTGLEWKKIKLNLSTSNPSQGTVLPALSPSLLQLYVPQLYSIVVAEKKERASKLDAYELDEVGAAPATLSVANDVSGYLNLQESQLNTNYEIDLPYMIPSDGKAYKITIKEEMLKASYRHLAVPKLDKDAFLTAQLASWDSLNLLPGEANIIMDNVYLGQSFINPNSTADTLELSLGRDKRVAIQRLRVKDLTSTSVRGETKTELYTFEITVRNNKKQSLNMMVKDQFPISRMKELEVKLIKDDGAKVDAEMGALSWDIILKPGEIKKIRFSYQLKYPKDKQIQGSRN